MPPPIHRLLKALVSPGRAPDADKANPRFLFLSYESALGWAVLGTATLAALKAQRPDAHITVATAGLPADVLRASPLVDELIVTPHAVRAFPAALRFFLKSIRPRRRAFDYVVTETASQRAKIAILALASGARWRIGLTLRPWLFHTGLGFDPALSNIANNLRVLEAVGLTGPAQEPAIHFTADDRVSAQALLDQLTPTVGPRIAVVSQGSKGHPNEWFVDRWAELLTRLATKHGAGLVFVGTRADRPAIDRLRSRIPAPTLSTAGQTDIPQLAALMALCDLVVTIDTGGLHVARATGTPTVVIGHAAVPKQTWLPLNEPRIRVLLHEHVPCALCMKPACATRECMQESTVDMVEQAIEHQLAAYPPSPSAREARANAFTVGAPARPAARAAR